MSQIQAAYNGSWVCQSQNYAKTRGIFFGDNPFRHPKAVILAQLSLASLFTAFFQVLVNPLGESGFFSQMMAGILLGPSLLGSFNGFKNNIFPLRSLYVSQTFSLIGCMFFLFLVGVRTDLSMIKKSGQKAVVIGFLTFILPLCLNLILAAIIHNKFDLEPTLKKSVFFIAGCQGISSFHVVVCLLTDLKLLNSELGRLATSSSLVSGLCSWFSIIACFTINTNFRGSQGKQDVLLYMSLSIGCLIILVAYILRPITLWMVKQMTPEKSVKEDHIFGVFLMVLTCAFFGEVIGQHLMLGPMMLGIAVPDGPPLGSALVTKLESYISSILLPSYFVLTASMVNFSTIHWDTLYVVEMLALSGFTAKLLATLLPSLYCKMPLSDALCLGLIMSAQGITDVLMLQRAFHLGLIGVDAYTIMAMSMVSVTGITTPIIKVLYNPSKRYVSPKRRTLQHTRPDAELRMMACIYTEDQVPSIINLLELSNPTSKSPICFYVVHLLELTGRSAPVLVSHRPGKKNSFQAVYYSEHIINAFRLYEQRFQGFLMMNLFTAVSPYSTMHDEICSLAVEKRVAMVIVPFHRHWGAHGAMDELPRPVRSANRNIIRNVPCSVGILIDRDGLSGTSSLSCKSLYSIGVIFVEGPDDREALAYALRMGNHPNVRITVVRLIDSKKHKVSYQSDHLDDQIINEFRIAVEGNKRHTFREEVVVDSVGTVAVIRSVENSFDLIIVGKRHDNESPLFLGLTEWNEFPELGFMGDMLASADSNCHRSVLVVQQQTFANELRGKDKFLFTDSCVILDMSRNSGKVWPVVK